VHDAGDFQAQLRPIVPLMPGVQPAFTRSGDAERHQRFGSRVCRVIEHELVEEIRLLHPENVGRAWHNGHAVEFSQLVEHV